MASVDKKDFVPIHSVLDKDKIKGVISIEMLGIFTSRKNRKTMGHWDVVKQVLVDNNELFKVNDVVNGDDASTFICLVEGSLSSPLTILYDHKGVSTNNEWKRFGEPLPSLGDVDNVASLAGKAVLLNKATSGILGKYSVVKQVLDDHNQPWKLSDRVFGDLRGVIFELINVNSGNIDPETVVYSGNTSAHWKKITISDSSNMVIKSTIQSGDIPSKIEFLNGANPIVNWTDTMSIFGLQGGIKFLLPTTTPGGRARIKNSPDTWTNASKQNTKITHDPATGLLTMYQTGVYEIFVSADVNIQINNINAGVEEYAKVALMIVTDDANSVAIDDRYYYVNNALNGRVLWEKRSFRTGPLTINKDQTIQIDVFAYLVDIFINRLTFEIRRVG